MPGGWSPIPVFGEDACCSYPSNPGHVSRPEIHSLLWKCPHPDPEPPDPGRGSARGEGVCWVFGGQEGDPATQWPLGLVALVSGEEDNRLTRLPQAGPGWHRSRHAKKPLSPVLPVVPEASKGKVEPFLRKSFSLF